MLNCDTALRKHGMDILAFIKLKEPYRFAFRAQMPESLLANVDVMGETKRQTTSVKSELPRSGVR